MLTSLIAFVRSHSPFYRDLYRHLPDGVSTVSTLPVLDQDAFWAANSLTSNRLLTGPMRDGIVLKSGGTTGKPKFSVFSRSEWISFTTAFGAGLALNGVEAGDRFANLFYVGELYGSFLFTHRFVEDCPTGMLQLPIGGATEVAAMVKIMRDFGATVMAALPTTVMSVMDYLEAHPGSHEQLKLRLVLFAGEAMYPGQRSRVERLFPQVAIRSIGYASTDAGYIGYADLSCKAGEFRVADLATSLEILDEASGDPLTAPGQPGRIVMTDLHRRLMPVLRYPVGDRAEWVEAAGTPNRKFLLLGRSEEGARIGPITLYYDDVNEVLQAYSRELPKLAFQLVLRHEGVKDYLVIRLAATITPEHSATLAPVLLEAFYRARPMYRECLEQGKVGAIRLEWTAMGGLAVNQRSGKLRRIIDERA